VNWSKVIAIYRKELLDCIRDKRTIISVLVLPMLLYPLLMIGFSSMITRQERKLESQRMNYFLEDRVNNDDTRMISDSLSRTPFMFRTDKTGDLRKLIGDHTVNAAIILERCDSLSALYPGYRATIVYDGSDDRSRLAHDRMKMIMEKLEKRMVSERLAELSLSTRILDAVATKDENTADPNRMLGFAIGKFLPYLLIMLTVSSGMVIASDIMAGEKERRTLETLLVSGARRNELVTGKFFTVITFSFATVVCNLFSIYLSMTQMMGKEVDLSKFHLPLGSFALFFVAMLPFISLMGALVLMVSTFSRNMKESQSYLSPIMIGCMVLSFAPMLPGVEMNAAFSLIPVVNIALLFKEIVLGQFNLLHYSMVIGSTLLLDVAAIWGMVRIFNQESMLFRVETEKSLKFWGKDRGNAFTPGFAMMVFALLILLLVYVGSKWQQKDIVTGLLQTEVILIYLPAYLIFRISKTDVRETIRLKAPKLSSLLLALLLAVPAFILANKFIDLIDLVYPIPNDYLARMGDLLRMRDSGIWLKLAVLALAPGICEEFLFRGYFLSAFRKSGFWPSILIVGVLFGVFHLDPFRSPPAALLGIWLGFLMLRSDSILVAMAAHFANNALSVLLGEYADRIPASWHIIEKGHLSWAIGAAALVVFAGLAWLFVKSTAPKTSGDPEMKGV
jgi:sodium transport system permease protein